MLVHRLRRWPNVKTASGECLMLLGRVVLARRALPPVCAAKRDLPTVMTVGLPAADDPTGRPIA